MKVPTKIIPDAVLNRVKRSTRVYNVARRIRFQMGSALGARHVKGIPGRCHYNDFMLDSTSSDAVAVYQNGAIQFVKILEDSLCSVGKSWSDLERVLEIGCGYGRIIRVLRDKIPPSRIYASDVIEEGASFSAREFGVNKMPILEKMQNSCEQTFDLIYMLSVYTHTPMDFMNEHLKLVSRALKPKGLFVFTTQGPIFANNVERYSQYWLDKDIVLEDLRTKGYSFQRYPYYYDEYGMAWHTEEYVRETIERMNVPLRFVRYGPAEHGGHQDVFVYLNNPSGKASNS